MGWAIHAIGLFAGNIADSVDVSATFPVVLEKTKIEYLEHQALSLKRPTRSKEGCGNPSRSELKLTSPSSSLTSFNIWVNEGAKWNGVVDGYPCYHKICDKLPEMEEYMTTENATGEANLVHSWDIVTWWAVYAFLHMDQTPVPNEL
ncbi:hypothetical protein N9Z48_00530 [Euryarchaeota archaeon]|nr:hypothetical protein [Euryarchaeota archaeon]